MTLLKRTVVFNGFQTVGQKQLIEGEDTVLTLRSVAGAADLRRGEEKEERQAGWGNANHDRIY